MAKRRSIFKKIRSIFETARIRTVGVDLPPRLHLRLVQNPRWQAPQDVEQNRQVLLSLGFKEVGVHTSDEIPNLQIDYFAHEEEYIVATIYESRSTGVWVDYLTDYQDDTSFNYTTAPKGRIHDVPDWDQQTSFAGVSTDDLHTKFLADRPNKPMRTVSVDEVIQVAEYAFASARR